IFYSAGYSFGFWLNLAIAVFNLLPLGRLDGSWILFGKPLNTGHAVTRAIGACGLPCTAMRLAQLAEFAEVFEDKQERKQASDELADMFEELGDSLKELAAQLSDISNVVDAEETEHQAKHAMEDTAKETAGGKTEDLEGFIAGFSDKLITRLSNTVLKGVACDKITAILDELSVSEGKTLKTLLEGWCEQHNLQDKISRLREKAQAVEKKDKDAATDAKSSAAAKAIRRNLRRGASHSIIFLASLVYSVLSSLSLSVEASQAPDFLDTLGLETEELKLLRGDEQEPGVLVDLGIRPTKPHIGRAKELSDMISILSTPEGFKNSLLLIGKKGVGKTALAEMLAQRLYRNQMRGFLAGRRIYSINYLDFRKKFFELLPVLEKTKNKVILFIDEFHGLTMTEANLPDFTFANILKPVLEEGRISVIGATTIGEYDEFIKKDEAYDRRFRTVVIDEPSVEEAREIMYGLRIYYEDNFGVTIEDAALDAVVSLTHRYLPESSLPSKAVDSLQDVITRVNTQADTLPVHRDDLLARLGRTSNRWVELNKRGPVGEAEETKLHNQVIRLIQDICGIRGRIEALQRKSISSDDVKDFLKDKTGIDIITTSQAEAVKLKDMEKELAHDVVGQEEAVKVLAKTVRRSKSGLKDPNRPIGVILLAGPTGVGKTALVKRLTEFLLGSEKAMVRLDMSEYMQKHNVARLIGAPPGYVG
ncbi:AAA family ATPase, partial [Candidatus Omnitrophota bacterium]